jgi:hypothetical protein
LADRDAAELVIAVEATGDLHRSWVSEFERRHPGSVRMFAPSETRSARTVLYQTVHLVDSAVQSCSSVEGAPQ